MNCDVVRVVDTCWVGPARMLLIYFVCVCVYSLCVKKYVLCFVTIASLQEKRFWVVLLCRMK